MAQVIKSKRTESIVTIDNLITNHFNKLKNFVEYERILLPVLDDIVVQYCWYEKYDNPDLAYGYELYQKRHGFWFVVCGRPYANAIRYNPNDFDGDHYDHDYGYEVQEYKNGILDGTFNGFYYFRDSNKIECVYKNDKLHGKCTEWFTNGTWREIIYKNNKMHGQFIFHSKNGDLQIGQYANDKKIGKWNKWNKDGKLIQKYKIKRNKYGSS